MKMMNNYYDTCSLLIKGKDIKEDEHILISSITIDELENIKTSANKDADVKYTARQLLRNINAHPNIYQVLIYKEKMIKPIQRLDLSITNDTKILATALDFNKHNKTHPIDNFITNDLTLKCIARLFLSNVSSLEENNQELYTGYIEKVISQEDLIKFYNNIEENQYNLLNGQYLILRDEDGNLLDVRCWTGSTYRYLNSKPIESKWFGKVSPYKGDVYQKCAIDSLVNNQLTVFRGGAGVGKSLLGLTYLFSLLEQGKIDKIYMFCNPVATRDSAKLGFYPGDKDLKLLDSQIGNFLVSKFGDRNAVEDLITNGKIILVPTADCRGMDITNNSGVYITEAQNSTIDLMKLMIQRIGENTKCVIEGDDKTQVDLISYSGNNNGLMRLSEVFRGQSYYGEVTLKNCYRSELAKQAELM